MDVAEAIRAALDSLAAHKLRSALTMLGMIFGVGAVIAMLAIGAGAERQALELIQRLGLSNVLVRARQQLKRDELEEMRKKSLGVSMRDARAIIEGVAGVERAAPRIEIETWRILAAGSNTKAKVFGVSAGHDQLSDLEVASGRFLDHQDERSHAQVAVIGERSASDLFGFDSPLGGRVKINDVWFEVVGMLRNSGGSRTLGGVTLGSTADEIYIPVTTAMRKFDRDSLQSPLDEIIVRLEDDVAPREAAAAIRALLDRLHSGAEDFELVVPEALLEQSRRTQRLFNIVMGCIAGISLLVGGIGIMNIMLATVLERTREIGVRRALGARGLDIRRQFLIESFAISAIGGLVGIAAGVLLAKVVAASAGWPTVVTLTSIALSTGVSVLVGLVSGIYPAARAAALDPIEALRYE